MSADPTPIGSRPVFWVVVLSLLHCGVWFLHYGNTPLGESPALDNRQTLLLAQAMADGTLSEEPFHRAPLYPWLLSTFISVGVPIEVLPWIARLLNGLALAAAAGSTAQASRKLWRHPAAPWISGLLVGLNPVLLFFAGDAFDILLATAALSLCLPAFLSWQQKPAIGRSICISLFLSIGAALRSHLLPLALAWPLLAAALAGRRRALHFACCGLPVLAGFIILGLANLQVAGEFRALPWQGSYNLWAGNKPDASGRIYAQVMRVDFEGSYDNPAKLESIALYQNETGATPPFSVTEMNAYWKGKFLDHVTAHPTEWLGLMARKAYFFLNSYEQYDNKTYGFHKQQHLQLKLNPVHWGALLLLAVPAVLAASRDEGRRRTIFCLVALFAIYAAGTILFYTSNRFRIPMVPVLALLSAGVIYVPAAWRTSRSIWRTTVLLSTALTAMIAYSGFFNARDTATWQEDYALLANASLRAGRDGEAVDWATEALRFGPYRVDMAGVIVQARLNQWAFASPPKPVAEDRARALLKEALAAGSEDPAFLPIAGIYKWKLGQHDQAVAIWEKCATSDPFARLCLVWTGKGPPPTPKEMMLYQSHRHYNLLKNAIRAEADPALSSVLDAIFAPVPVR